jgi:hypothetical protein
MALQKTIVLKSNFNTDVAFNSAYIKVDSLVGNKNQMRINLTIQDKKDGSVLNTNMYFFKPLLNEQNFIAQAYEHLKTLSEFADSVDC